MPRRPSRCGSHFPDLRSCVAKLPKLGSSPGESPYAACSFRLHDASCRETTDATYHICIAIYYCSVGITRARRGSLTTRRVSHRRREQAEEEVRGIWETVVARARGGLLNVQWPSFA
ncbi:hypothetical protein KC359_g219 [Hortaea werneckii]|nr:hypothetical protein KC359_g219 [Hortaea werneckii]